MLFFYHMRLVSGLIASFASISLAAEHYKEVIEEERGDVSLQDLKTIEASVEKLKKTSRDLVLESMRAGIPLGLIPTPSNCERCLSNRDFIISRLASEHPDMKFWKATSVTRDEMEFSSAYDSDTYTTDTHTPSICFRIVTSKVP